MQINDAGSKGATRAQEQEIIDRLVVWGGLGDRFQTIPAPCMHDDMNRVRWDGTLDPQWDKQFRKWISGHLIRSRPSWSFEINAKPLKAAPSIVPHSL